MDEAWYCFEKGIEKQISPGYPHMQKRRSKLDENGVLVKEVYEDKRRDDSKPSEVHVRPYPRCVDPSQYKVSCCYLKVL